MGVVGLCLGLALSMSVAFCVQPPAMEWTRTFEGNGTAAGYCVQQTSDGGFIVAGTTTADTGNSLCYLLKTDSLGNAVWYRTDGGHRGAGAQSVLQAADEGFVMAGEGWVGESSGVYLMRTDVAGNLQWQRILLEEGGGGFSVVSAGDGGYVVSVLISSTDSAICLIKVDSLGNRLWGRRYGGYYGSSAVSIPLRRTADKGFIVGAKTLLKTDSLGNQQWLSAFNEVGCAYSVLQSADGGFLATGLRGSPANPRRHLMYLLKADSLGNRLWLRDYDASQGEGLWIESAGSSGYIIAGNIWSHTEAPPFITRTDSAGNIVWTKTLEGMGGADCIRPTADGGYIVTGGCNAGTVDAPEYLYLTKLAPEQQK
jgi:hypothetical protein